MSNILGNQEQRKSKVDTEKWKEHAEYYNNPKKENFTETNHPAEQQDLEKKVLKYYILAHPELKLDSDILKAVVTPTQKEYDQLMQIYEAGGWQIEYFDGKRQVSQATGINLWKRHTIHTLVASGRLTRYNDFTAEVWHIDTGSTIDKITLQKFCELNDITSDMLKELSEWYETNAPNRASKG